MTLVIGPNPSTRRPHTVTWLTPDWDTATWNAIPSPVAGAPTSNLFTRQPVQVAGYDVSAEDLVLEGTQATPQIVDAVCIPYATATPEATIRIQCGDGPNEAQGERAIDASGNGRFAVRNGATSFAQGKYGSGLALGNEDHNDDYLATAATLTVEEWGTYLGWFCPTLLGETRVLFSHGGAADERHCGFVLADGRVQIGVDPLCVTPSPVLVPGSWTHLAFVFDSVDHVQLYVDGALVVDQDVATGSLLITDPYVLNWGASAFDTYGFAGTYDDLRYYGNTLTEADVQAEMASEAVTVAGLILQYKLNGYDSGVITFGAAPNKPFKRRFQRRLMWHLLPYQLTCKVVRLTISDPTNTAALRLGRLVVGEAFQPEQNFDYGWMVGRDDDTKKSITPTGQTTTNSRVARPYVEFTVRHISRSVVVHHFDELQRDFGTSDPFVVCCDPEDDVGLQMITLYGTAADLRGMPNQYADKWESSWRVEAML